MGRKKDKSNLYDKMMDEISQFLFRKPYYSLQLSEIKIISDYFNDLSNQVYKPIIINSIDTGWLVSNIGTIKDQNGVIIKPSQSGNGYLNVYINEKFGVLGVHRLVAEAFIPNPENKPQVNHLNGVKYCNWWRNLEWNTAKENARHAWDNGLTNNYGENQGSSKYTNKEIEYVCKLLSEGLNHDEINKITNVDKNIIYNIHNNLTWKFISKNYGYTSIQSSRKEIFYRYNS